jgi:hypothetical protein
MSKEIKTQIIIQASPEKVWSILTDFKNYPEWNPFIRSIDGNTLAGSKIHVFIAPPEKKGMALRPKILVFHKQREFRWKGKLWTGGLFDGEHLFELIDNGNGSTTFIQSEKFSGVLIPLFAKMIDVNTLNGFNLMNEKLKERVEAGS